MTVPAARHLTRTGEVSGFVTAATATAADDGAAHRHPASAVVAPVRRRPWPRALRRLLPARRNAPPTWESKSVIDPIVLDELAEHRRAGTTPHTKRLITFGAVAMIVSAMSTVFAKPLGDALRSGTTLFAQSTLSGPAIGAIAALVVIAVTSGAWIIAAHATADATRIAAPVRMVAACAVVGGAITLIALIALLLTSARV